MRAVPVAHMPLVQVPCWQVLFGVQQTWPAMPHIVLIVVQTPLVQVSVVLLHIMFAQQAPPVAPQVGAILQTFIWQVVPAAEQAVPVVQQAALSVPQEGGVVPPQPAMVRNRIVATPAKYRFISVLRLSQGINPAGYTTGAPTVSRIIQGLADVR